MDFIDELKEKLNTTEFLLITVKVTAGAKKNSIEKADDNLIRIKINKPPVDGKANKAIIEYLSDVLSVPKTNITILRGEKSSIKDLRIVPKRNII